MAGGRRARYRERAGGASTPRGSRTGSASPGCRRCACCELGGPDAGQLEASLRHADIETRRWWGDGAHTHRSTRQYPRTALPVTEQLARSTIAVPFFRDMQTADIDRVIESALSSGR